MLKPPLGVDSIILPRLVTDCRAAGGGPPTAGLDVVWTLKGRVSTFHLDLLPPPPPLLPSLLPHLLLTQYVTKLELGIPSDLQRFFFEQ